MKSKIAHSFIISLILMGGHLATVTAVTDAELKAIKKQIGQQAAEEEVQTKAIEKKKTEVEVKRKAEQKRKAE